MQTDSFGEQLRLAEHYRTLYDGELLNLAANSADLTDSARQVLATEMTNRGLKLPAEDEQPAKSRRAIDLTAQDAAFNQSLLPGSDDVPMSSGRRTSFAPESDDEEGEQTAEADYTWKTVLCEVEEPIQAYALRVVLAKAGIESWVEGDRNWGGSGLPYPRVLVAADELDAAREIASKPIPQEIFDDLSQEVPEFDPGSCPACHAPEPVLEDVEPTNQWLCEACGHQWSDPVVQE